MKIDHFFAHFFLGDGSPVPVQVGDRNGLIPAILAENARQARILILNIGINMWICMWTVQCTLKKIMRDF